MHSTIYQGKVLVWRFKKVDWYWSFSIGHIAVGNIYHLTSGYSAVLLKPHEYNNVGGFKTRHKAAEYLLRIGGYHD